VTLVPFAAESVKTALGVNWRRGLSARSGPPQLTVCQRSRSWCASKSWLLPLMIFKRVGPTAVRRESVRAPMMLPL